MGNIMQISTFLKQMTIPFSNLPDPYSSEILQHSSAASWLSKRYGRLHPNSTTFLIILASFSFGIAFSRLLFLAHVTCFELFTTFLGVVSLPYLGAKFFFSTHCAPRVHLMLSLIFSIALQEQLRLLLLAETTLYAFGSFTNVSVLLRWGLIVVLSVYGIRPYPGHYVGMNVSMIGYGVIRALSRLGSVDAFMEVAAVAVLEFFLARLLQKQIFESDAAYCYRKLWKQAARRKKGWKTLVKETPNSAMLIFERENVLFTNTEFYLQFGVNPTSTSDMRSFFGLLKCTSAEEQGNLWNILTEYVKKKQEGKKELGEFAYQAQSNEENWKHFSASIDRISWKKREAYLLHLFEITSHKKAQTELISKHYRNILLTTASHELMTPLNGILGGIQLIENCESIDEVKQYCEIITCSCKFLVNITDDMHDYCLYESGCLVVNTEMINLKGLIEDTIQVIKVQTSQRGVEVKMEYDDTIPEPIFTDKKRLRQVFLNLLSNAAKYTFKGSIVFTAKYKEPLIIISIADTGIGISETKKKSLFKLFGDESTSPSSLKNYVGAGSGLGLTVSQALTKILGTGISFTTEENVGSCFTFGIFREMARKRSKSLWGLSPIMQPRNKRRTVWIPPIRKGNSRISLRPISSPVLRSRKEKEIAEKSTLDISPNRLTLIKSRKSSLSSENYSARDNERNVGSPARSVSGYNLVLKNSFSSTYLRANQTIKQHTICA
eukprot:TRINITY_DN305_c0_g1_i2.p1 TRINITY_DN305_c0_g1~~TRINITY_DN305_c0_g1_i2.p1  ORF type:complete len:721 (+),score=39.65 TRINITY_DN305_c0_g1_i2:2201-4363(+)